MQEKARGIVRWKSLKKILDGTSRSSVDRWEKALRFPKRLRLGKNSVGWSLQAVEQWLEERSNAAEESN